LLSPCTFPAAWWHRRAPATAKTFPVVDEFQPQIEAFSLAIRGGPLPPSCGVDGYIDMAIIEALYRSATTGVPQDVKVIPSS
jgi:predicted dehydrogenase